MIADLAPIDHDPHRLAVTVYHHEVEGRREGVILEGLRQRVRVVSLVEPHRQHAAIWADGTKDAGLLHSDIDAVAQRLLKIFFHLWVSIRFRERVGERRALLTHHDIVMVSPAVCLFWLRWEKNAALRAPLQRPTFPFAKPGAKRRLPWQPHLTDPGISLIDRDGLPATA